VNILEEQDGGHSSKSKSTVDCGKAGSCVGLAATLAGRVVALLAGVDDFALAEEGTLDGLVVVERRVEVAGGGDVVGGLEVEGTFDVADAGSFNVRHVAAHIKSTANLLKQRETINLHQSTVVGNDKVVLDGGQHGEREVIQFVVGND